MDNMTRFAISFRMYSSYKSKFLREFGLEMRQRNKNTLRRCVTYQVGVMANGFVDQRVKKVIHGFL